MMPTVTFVTPSWLSPGMESMSTRSSLMGCFFLCMLAKAEMAIC